MLCWFLPYSNMKQPQVHLYTFPLVPPSHPDPHPTPLGHQSTGRSSLYYAAASHHLSVLHISSVQFSRSAMSDSFRSHEPKHARPPCPSPAPRVHPNPRTLSWWCHPTTSSFVIPFCSCPQSLPASGSFQMSQLFTSGGQSIWVSASTSILPMNTQEWSLGWTGWIFLQSKGLSRVFSNTTVQKHQFFCTQLSL